MSPRQAPPAVFAPLTRRALLRRGSLVLGGLAAASAGTLPRVLADSARPPALVFGALTDIHYADKPSAGNRHYREALDKLEAALDHLRDKQPGFIVELGDFIDKTDTVEQEIGFLRTVEQVFAKAPCDRHYVLGNHCIDTLVKDEFLENCGARAPHYSFDQGGFHFVVLDSCYNSDGDPYGRGNYVWTDANIPAAQIRWLREDLERTGKPVVVFAHQRLDGEGAHFVNNAGDVRAALAASGKVLAVLQGHNHRNDYRQLDGIHYCTLVAMVEGSGADHSGASLVSMFDDGSIRIDGFLRQSNYHWPAGAAGAGTEAA